MKNISVWRASEKSYSQLSGNTARRTVVIGGGIAGFLTAFLLRREGRQVTLLEADKLFSGTTGKTTGKISCNQETVYYDLFKKYGRATAKAYFLSQLEARQAIVSLIREYEIDCDLERVDSYIFTDGETEKLKGNYKLLKEFGADCELVDNLSPFDSKLALKMGGEYVFDPLKFLSGLPVDFEIFEHTRVIEVDCDRKLIVTDCGVIAADEIIVATHFPIINNHGGYIVKLRQSQSYLAAIKKQLVRDAYLDLKKDGITVRPYAEGTIIGGGDHRTGRCDGADRADILKRYAVKHFGTGAVSNFWCAEDVMTADGMPMAGKYWVDSDGIFVITGFNKWGMTNSMACAKVVRNIILGREDAFIRLFSPQRRIKGAFTDYAVNAAVTIKDVALGYLGLTLKTEEDIPEGSGAVVRYRGRRRAVYKEAGGKIYALDNRCPHLRGELKWNPACGCWECPCHGSRFDIYGNIISGPATKSCKKCGE